MSSDGNASYYSERVRGPRPRDLLEVTDAAWGGIVALYRGCITDGSFGSAFPEECPDGAGISGTSEHDMRLRLCGELPTLDWPLTPGAKPETDIVFDLVEYGWRHVAAPIQRDYHSFFRHHHLDFDVATGRANWREGVNRILRRNGIAFELGQNGQVTRLLPTPLSDELLRTEFDAGDETLDGLLEQSVRLFTDRHAEARRDAVEKLWHAFERAKTLADGDKKRSAQQLLEMSASSPEFLGLLESEARSLTAVGNQFRIRHSETDKVELTDQELDYLFARLFSLLWHLLVPGTVDAPGGHDSIG